MEGNIELQLPNKVNLGRIGLRMMRRGSKCGQPMQKTGNLARKALACICCSSRRAPSTRQITGKPTEMVKNYTPLRSESTTEAASLSDFGRLARAAGGDDAVTTMLPCAVLSYSIAGA